MTNLKDCCDKGSDISKDYPRGYELVYRHITFSQIDILRWNEEKGLSQELRAKSSLVAEYEKHNKL